MKMFVKRLIVASIFAGTGANAEVLTFKGSDSLHGAIDEAIKKAGLEADLKYEGGGSGEGEKAMIAKLQAIAPMSRPFKPDALTAARANGVEPIGHIIGLDGVGIFVNARNPLRALQLEDLKKIYTCEIGRWEQIPGTSLNGPIKAYRRNDKSGTTDTFKTLLKITDFGACVTMVNESSEIAKVTSTNPNSIGFSGLSAGTNDNKAVAVSPGNQEPSVLPTIDNIRTKKYPLSRDLYIFEATRGHTTSGSEAELLNKMLDRSFMDPIIVKNEFVTLD